MIILKLGYNAEYMIPESMMSLLPSMVKVEQVGDKWIRHKTDISVILTEEEIVEDKVESEILKLKEELKTANEIKNYYERQTNDLKKKVEDGQKGQVV